MARTRSRTKHDQALRSNNDENLDPALPTEESLLRFKSHLSTFTSPSAIPSQPSTSLKRPLSPQTQSTVSPPRKPRRGAGTRKPSSKYAPPSTYAHLPHLVDILAPSLICVFVGTNPGIRTATAGHAYAHPSNLFWRLLHSSGCTDERLRPSQDVDLPRLYAMGNTNIVARPSRDAAQLSKREMEEGTPILEEKVGRYRPEAVCIVGKGIWEAVWRWRYKRGLGKEFEYGWQEGKENLGRVEGEWDGARVFVATSTSGLAAGMSLREKEGVWRVFGEWVRERRRERGQVKGEEAGDVKEEEQEKE